MDELLSDKGKALRDKVKIAMDEIYQEVTLTITFIWKLFTWS